MQVTISARIGEDLAKVIDEVCKEEGVGRSTVVRRFLIKAIKDWQVEKSLKDDEKGKITLWQAADECGVSLWEIIMQAKQREIHVPHTLDEFREDLNGLQNASE